MSKKKPMPKCPYCGAKMHLEDNEYIVKECYNDDETQKRYWYGCRNKDCGGTSPRKKTKWTAYRAAMRRYEAPNRVLTWEEVLKACDETEWVLLWREWNVENAALYIEQICPADRLSNEDVVFVSPGDSVEGTYNKSEYGKRLRCWAHKPTEQEMILTPWEEKS